MSFNNYKSDIAVVRNATPTDEQIQNLHDLGLTADKYLDPRYSSAGNNFAVLVGDLQHYYLSQEDAAIARGLEVERAIPAYPEYVESDAVFDTIDDLIEALKP